MFAKVDKMIKELASLFGYSYQGRTNQINSEEFNKLFAAFYGAYNLNNTVAWLDNKAETFINEGYRGNAAIYSIVNKLMMKDAEPPLLVYKETADRKKRHNSQLKFKGTPESIAETRLSRKELTLVEPRVNTLSGLLDKPNKGQTQYSFLQDISMYWRLTGEFFIYGKTIELGRDKGKFSELFVLPSHLVQIIQGDMFEPVSGYKFLIGDQQVILKPDEVLHVKSPNPNWNLQGSQLRGQGALLAGLKYLQKNTESIASLYRAVLNEGAKGFVSPFPVTNPELWFNSQQIYSLKDQIQSVLQGVQNKNKVGSMAYPMSYTDIAKSPADLETLKAMDADFKVFCNLWGVNPAIFSADQKHDNMQFALKALVTDCCFPLQKQIEQGLSDWLLPRYKGEADYLEFDVTEYAELQPDVKMVMETYGKSMAYTPNEVRIMLGSDESDAEGMDSHWVPSGTIPMEDAVLGNNLDLQDFPLR